MSAPFRASCSAGLSCSRRPLRNQWTEFTTMLTYSIVTVKSRKISQNEGKRSKNVDSSTDSRQTLQMKINTLGRGLWRGHGDGQGFLFRFAGWTEMKTSTRIIKLESCKWLRLHEARSSASPFQRGTASRLLYLLQGSAGGSGAVVWHCYRSKIIVRISICMCVFWSVWRFVCVQWNPRVRVIIFVNVCKWRHM